MDAVKSMQISKMTTLLTLVFLFLVFFLYGDMIDLIGNDKVRFIHFIINLLIVIVSCAVTIQLWFSTKFNHASREIYVGSNYFLISLLLIINFSIIDYSLKVPESNAFRIQLVVVIDSITILLLPLGLIVAHRRKNKLLSANHRIGAFLFAIVAAAMIYGIPYYYFFVQDIQFPPQYILDLKVMIILAGGAMHLWVLKEFKKYYDEKTVKIYKVVILYFFLHYFFFLTYQNIFDASYLLAYLTELLAIFVIFRGVYYLSIREPYVELARKNEEITNIAFYEELTKLPNSYHYKTYMNAYLNGDDDKKLVLLIELERLDLVRAALGVSMSELIRVELSERLKKIAPDAYYLAAIDTNQLLFSTKYKEFEEVAAWCEDIITSVKEPFQINNYLLRPRVTIGSALYPQHANKSNMLLRFCNQALIEAHKKALSYKLYEEQWNSEIVEQFELENDLVKALQNQEIYLLYQPQYSVETMELHGAEALVRWQHPTRGLISPEFFIPILERSGMIAELGEYVLRKACSDAKRWELEFSKPIQIGVNLSLAQLLLTDYVKVVKNVLASTDYAPQNLKIEVTESTTLNIKQVFPVLEELRALGVKIAIDDFGTGYSSLSYLYEFPVDTLKVDRSFVVQIGQQGKGEKILSAIIGMSKSLGFEIIAEGVENQEQFVFLSEEGCELFQGFLISPPITMQQLIAQTTELEKKMQNLL